MAAGKSTIGRHLARELDVAFVDTDALIVRAHGPIDALFARVGESGFRELELEAVREALARPPGILALGGGAPTHAPTRALLAAGSLRVYLDVAPEALFARLSRSRSVRPVFGTAPTLESIRALLALRDPHYRDADLVVSGPRRTQAAYAHVIAELVREAS